MKLFTKFERNRTIRGGIMAISVFDLMTLNIFFDAGTLRQAVTLTFDLLTLKVRGTSSTSGVMRLNSVKIGAKSNNPRLSYRLFSAFSRAILKGGSELTKLSHGCVDLHQTWPGHRAIIAAVYFCFRIGISCCIFKSGRLKFE